MYAMNEPSIFCDRFTLSAYKLVTDIGCKDRLEDSYWLVATCHATDSYGFVYPLELNFLPLTKEKHDTLVKRLEINSIPHVEGQYLMSTSAEKPTSLYEPIIKPLPDDFVEEEIWEVFRDNVNWECS